MSELVKTQSCPYCGYAVDDAHAEWEEGSNLVTCDKCEREYSVTTHYIFLGFEVQKVCSECGESEDECYCEDGETE